MPGLVKTDEFKVFCLHRQQIQIKLLLCAMKDLHPRMYFRNARLQMWFLESCKGQAPELVLPIAEFKGRSFLWIQTNGLTPRSTGLRFTSKPIPTPNFTQKCPNLGKQLSLHERSLLRKAYENRTKKALCNMMPKTGTLTQANTWASKSTWYSTMPRLY